MKEKYYERLERLAKEPNSSLLMWGYEASAILKEIERLNNIINELEKYLIEQVEKSYSNDYDNALDKLDELKGSDKE